MSVDVPEVNRSPRRYDALRRRVGGAVTDRFRLPGENDPAPAPNHLAVICAWAAALGLGGVAVLVRALVGLIAVDASWYAPTVVLIGLAGLGATIAAFASVHRQRLPLILLGAATVALLVGWVVTGLG